METGKRLTIWGIILNSVLFVMKIIIGIASNSLAVLSDAFNSLVDIISSVGIFIAVKISYLKADKGHPFGHHRAEPLAGFAVAILAGIIGFEILRNAIEGLFTERDVSVGMYVIVVLVIAVLVKAGMAIFFLRHSNKAKSPAIRAAGVDSRNDMLVSGVALAGAVSSIYGYKIIDNIAAIAIGIFITYSGYKIGVENMDYLMGSAPSKSYTDKIKKLVKKTDGVKGLNDLRAHYVGSFIHIEIHIEVDRGISTDLSHKIGKEVQKTVESLEDVDKAFIHIDPV
jgi:cation diffusion facilitator family transporter